MSYPADIDTFSNPSGTTLLSTDDHALQHRTEGSAIVALEQKVGLSAGTPKLNYILSGLGNGTSGWGTVWDNATLGTPQITGGTVATSLLGTSQITGGTVANALIGTSTITGGTITTILVVRKTLGSAVYSGTAGGTTTLDLSTATRFLVNMPNSAGSVTLAVSNVVANQPFLAEILQGTSGLGTIGWFTTIRWAGGSAPTQVLTANKKDTFGFIPTSGTTFDAYIVGTNL